MVNLVIVSHSARLGEGVGELARQMLINDGCKLAIAAGIDVTHIDSHMGALICPEFVETYVKVALDYALPALLTRSYADYDPRHNLGDLSDTAPLGRAVARVTAAGGALAAHFGALGITKVLTAEISGIAPALTTALAGCGSGDAGTTGLGDKVWLAILAELFGVARVIEAKAVWNSANEQNDSSPTMGFIFPKGMLLTYAAPNPGRKIPSAGYTFSWRGYLGGPAKGIRFIKARNDVRRADTIVAEQSFEQKIVAADLGTYFASVVA